MSLLLQPAPFSTAHSILCSPVFLVSYLPYTCSSNSHFLSLAWGFPQGISSGPLIQIKLTKSALFVCVSISTGQSRKIWFWFILTALQIIFSFLSVIFHLFFQKLFSSIIYPRDEVSRPAIGLGHYFLHSVEHTLHSLFFNHVLNCPNTSSYPDILLHIGLQDCWKISDVVLLLEVPLPVLWDYLISTSLNAIIFLEGSLCLSGSYLCVNNLTNIFHLLFGPNKTSHYLKLNQNSHLVLRLNWKCLPV